jgi:hypothetical protein
MKNRVFGSCVLVGLLSFVGVQAASAQDSPLSVSANYDFVYHAPGDTSAAGAHFDVAGAIGGGLDLVGEVGFNHFEGTTVQSYLGGARYILPHAASGSYTPFAQVLVGAWRCCDGDISEFALQPGFGVDFETGKGFAVRGQIDYRRVFFEGEGENHVRVSAGVVFGLK